MSPLSIASWLLLLLALSAFAACSLAGRHAVGGIIGLSVLTIHYAFPMVFDVGYGQEMAINNEFDKIIAGTSISLFGFVLWGALQRPIGAFVGAALGAAFHLFVLKIINFPDWFGILFWLLSVTVMIFVGKRLTTHA